MRLTSLFLLVICAVLVAAGAVQAAPLSAGRLAHTAGSVAVIHTIHGCHQTWAPGRQGWHRHGPRCALRQGITDRTKRHGKSKALAT